MITTIEKPGLPDPALVDLIDAATAPAHSVSTVASTVFPSSMYADPGLAWRPDLPTTDEQRLDDTAQDLYDSYRFMLPTIMTEPSNKYGTYFGRLVSWPCKTGDGYNQLKVRVRQLRYQRRRNHSSANAADMVVEGLAEYGSGEADGLQVYKSTDERIRAFPCLVHIDLSVLQNRLSLLAVYRHWHMITKAYGNLIGLSRLHNFLAQQSGYELGEMVVHGTVSNAQFKNFSKRFVHRLAADAETILSGVAS
ncbi:MAG: hypothetical protein WCF33_14095 [Pseudonocardiaceae bacterium]